MPKVFCTLLLVTFGFFGLAQNPEELNNQAYQQYRQGNYLGSLESYQKALPLLEAQYGAQHPLVGQQHVSIGITHYLLNHYPQALAELQQAQQIFEKSFGANNENTGRVYLYMGDLYNTMDDYPQALSFYGKAHSSFAGALGPENQWTAQTLSKTSFLYTRLGNLNKALGDALQAVQIAEKALGPEKLESATAYEQAAYVYLYLKQPQQELEYLRKALIAKEKNLGRQHIATADTLKSLGEAYQRSGDSAKALQYVQQALDIYNGLYGPEHPATAFLSTSLAKLYQEKKDYGPAVDLLQKAVPLLSKAFGPTNPAVSAIQLQLGLLYQEMKEYPQALEVFQQTLTSHQKIFGDKNINTAISFGAMGSVYSQMSDFTQALAYYSQAFDAFFAQQSIAFQALDNQGKLHYKAQNHKFATGMLRVASQSSTIDLPQQQQVLERWLSFKGSVFAFENGFAALLQQASPELRKQLETYLNLRRELALLYSRTPIDEAQAAANQTEIARKTETLTQMERELSKQIQHFEDRLALSQIRWSDLAEQLREGELYVDYAWAEENPILLSLDARGNVSLHLLGDAKTIADLLSALRTGIQAGKTMAELAGQSQLLYQNLLGPLEPSLTSVRTLVISPDGPLAFLPFELLSDGKQLLLERFTLRYTPSGRDLLRLRSNPVGMPNISVAIFGNPAFSASSDSLSRGSSSALPSKADLWKSLRLTTRSTSARSLADLLRNANFNALPGTEQEARTIAALMGRPSRMYLGQAANEENLFKLSSPRVLHLATHGFFINSPDIPNPLLRVGIALSGAKASVVEGERYGILTALQLSSLKLSGTQLVVLSACETGLGDAVAGEGVAGLNQAFLSAGAVRVMLSLWKVPDQETALLMESFYKGWTSGLSVAEALRQAKLDLMKQGLEPLKWAAFVLNGE